MIFTSYIIPAAFLLIQSPSTFSCKITSQPSISGGWQLHWSCWSTVASRTGEALQFHRDVPHFAGDPIGNDQKKKKQTKSLTLNRPRILRPWASVQHFNYLQLLKYSFKFCGKPWSGSSRSDNRSLTHSTHSHRVQIHGGATLESHGICKTTDFPTKSIRSGEFTQIRSPAELSVFFSICPKKIWEF